MTRGTRYRMRDTAIERPLDVPPYRVRSSGKGWGEKYNVDVPTSKDFKTNKQTVD